MNHPKTIMNGVEIDVGISTLIQTLWDNDIETIQCCQGGYVKDKEDRFTFILDGKIIDKAHIIFLKKDIDKIKPFLPFDTCYVIGDKSKKGFFEEWLGAFDGVWASFIHTTEIYEQ